MSYLSQQTLILRSYRGPVHEKVSKKECLDVINKITPNKYLAKIGQKSGIARLLRKDIREGEILTMDDVADGIENIVACVWVDSLYNVDAPFRVMGNIGIFDKKRDSFQHILGSDNGEDFTAFKKMPPLELKISRERFLHSRHKTKNSENDFLEGG